MKKNEIEICDFEKVLRQFGIYRNTLPKEHNEFVKRQLQKDYDTVTKTYNLQGRIYRGTFREDSTRKFNKEASKNTLGLNYRDDMRKIRAAHFERPLSRRAPDVSIEPSDTF